jgi:HAD superfamily hydrolase (TIGR01509 family)
MNIVFDFGGVVFNWQPHALLQQLLPRHASDDASARDLTALIFQGYAPGSDWAEFDLGRVDAHAVAERIARRTGLAEADVRAIVQAIPSHLAPQADTVALLGRLKAAGHRLFYLSNMPAPYADYLERSHPFFDWFDDGVFSARVQLMKPQPAIFREAAQRFGVAPAELLFIDDLAHNIDAARALGWQGLHFQGAAACEAALPPGTL